MQKTITVNWIKVNKGTNKRGNPYILYQISAEDGNLYSQFGELGQEVEKGDEIILEAKESGKKGYLNIERIIAVSHPAPKPGKQEAKESKFLKPEFNIELNIELAKKEEEKRSELIAYRLKLARELVNKEMPDAKNYDGYNILVSEIVGNLRAEAWIQLELRKMADKKW
jgi:hypothetical protein